MTPPRMNWPPVAICNGTFSGLHQLEDKKAATCCRTSDGTHPLCEPAVHDTPDQTAPTCSEGGPLDSEGDPLGSEGHIR